MAVSQYFDRGRLARIADGLVVAVAVSPPWSTSATGILIALWLLAFIPTIDTATLRRGSADLKWAGCRCCSGCWRPSGCYGPTLRRANGWAALLGFHRLLVSPMLLAPVPSIRKRQFRPHRLSWLGRSAAPGLGNPCGCLLRIHADRALFSRGSGQGLHRAKHHLRDLHVRTARRRG